MKSIITPTGAPIKILIIRLSSIGDILLSTPFIRQVRKKFPNAQIEFAVKDIYKDLIKYNPHIDNFYTINSNKKEKDLAVLKGILKEKSYDIVFDLHNNLRSNYLKLGINAKNISSIRKEKLKQFLLVWFKLNLYGKATPIPNRYLSVAKKFAVEDDGEGLELFWQEDSVLSAEKKVSKIGLSDKESFIGLAPGAGFYTKRWPADKFVNLINIIQDDLSKQIVIFGGENDSEISLFSGKEKGIIDLRGQLTLLETAYIISKGKAIVSNDSGLMHMATAVQTPVVAIFGSTVKELGFFPYRSESYVVENKNILCRPCSHIGRDTCPKGHFNCMEEISPEQIYDELKRFIK